MADRNIELRNNLALCDFIMLVPSAFSQAVATFVAQNVGAGKEERARKVLWVGIGISLSFGIVISWFFFSWFPSVQYILEGSTGCGSRISVS